MNNHIVSTGDVASGKILSVIGNRSIISNNNFVTSGSNEQHIFIGVSQVIVAGNTFAEGRGVLTASAGISDIANNLFINVYDGIELGDFCNNSVIQGNILFGASNSSGWEGIKITTNNDDCVVTGNRITSFNIGIAITASTTDRCVVSGNALNGNTTAIDDSGTGTVTTGGNSS